MAGESTATVARLVDFPSRRLLFFDLEPNSNESSLEASTDDDDDDDDESSFAFVIVAFLLCCCCCSFITLLLLSFFFIIIVVVKVVFVCTPQRALLLAMLQKERREEGVNVAIAFVDRCFVGFLMLLLFALGVVVRVINIDDVVGDTLVVADIIIFLLSQKLLLRPIPFPFTPPLLQNRFETTMMLSRRVFLSLFFRWMMYVYIVSIIPTLTENATRVAMKIVRVVVVFLPFSKTSKKQRKGKKESSFCGKGVRFEEEPKREERRPQRRKRETF